MKDLSRNSVIGVIGLGYVGLPLALGFAKKFRVIGYDIKEDRISELRDCIDSTGEASTAELNEAKNFYATSNQVELKNCNIYIVTVPTPIDSNKEPDLFPLLSACSVVASVLDPGDLVIFESTVYPGCTEEVCIPKIKQTCALEPSKDFYYGYSPERINPGDKDHKLQKIVKVTAGCCDYSAKLVDDLYKTIIVAGTHRASSIKVAEAAKIIENTQRDVNIALMNELSMIFDAEGIDTLDVLNAAATKWNFINFSPGLVGGHCIGVDPYYLAHRAKALGVEPNLILAGRNTNDMYPEVIIQKFVRAMERYSSGDKVKILIVGTTFKENCPDLRNSLSLKVIEKLIEKDFDIDVWDPVMNIKDCPVWLKPNLVTTPLKKNYRGVMVLVPHNETLNSLRQLKHDIDQDAIFFDLKGVLDDRTNTLRP